MKSVICVNSCPLGNKEVTNQDGLKVCISEKNDVTTSQTPATVTESSTKSMYDTILSFRENKQPNIPKENKIKRKKKVKQRKKTNSMKTSQKKTNQREKCYKSVKRYV